MQGSTSESWVYAIERPDRKLLTLYIIRAVMSGPAMIILIPLFLFRYHTLRYKFEPEGIMMSWGLLFRRQVALNYPRIQDIHLESGVIQRWLGLADIQIQTASGSSEAEMVIEGIIRYEELRDFLYSRMRGCKEHLTRASGSLSECHTEFSSSAKTSEASGEELALLSKIVDELAGIRAGLEASKRGAE